jgi:hypothetical protein
VAKDIKSKYEFVAPSRWNEPKNPKVSDCFSFYYNQDGTIVVHCEVNTLRLSRLLTKQEEQISTILASLIEIKKMFEALGNTFDKNCFITKLTKGA